MQESAIMLLDLIKCGDMLAFEALVRHAMRASDRETLGEITSIARASKHPWTLQGAWPLLRYNLGEENKASDARFWAFHAMQAGAKVWLTYMSGGDPCPATSLLAMHMMTRHKKSEGKQKFVHLTNPTRQTFEVELDSRQHILFLAACDILEKFAEVYSVDEPINAGVFADTLTLARYSAALWLNASKINPKNCDLLRDTSFTEYGLSGIRDFQSVCPYASTVHELDRMEQSGFPKQLSAHQSMCTHLDRWMFIDDVLDTIGDTAALHPQYALRSCVQLVTALLAMDPLTIHMNAFNDEPVSPFSKKWAGLPRRPRQKFASWAPFLREYEQILREWMFGIRQPMPVDTHLEMQTEFGKIIADGLNGSSPIGTKKAKNHANEIRSRLQGFQRLNIGMELTSNYFRHGVFQTQHLERARMPLKLTEHDMLITGTAYDCLVILKQMEPQE